MTPSRSVLVAAFAAAALGSLPACRRAAGPAVSAPAIPARGQPEVGPGSVGCAALRCHGESIPADAEKKPDDAWNWAASVWRTQDSHSRAFRTLLGPESKAIVKRLGETTPAGQNPRCLGCHSDPLLAHLDASPAVADARSDGVGCESCHGNAAHWLAVHHTWPASEDLLPLYARHRMVWLNDLTDRAAVCAGCHVGAAAGADVRVRRDVNHDLIAAGHPRLNFEFATYLRAMPPHWQEKDRRRRGPLPPDFATRAWSAGQVAALRASLSLLADRLPAPGKPDPERPWPEFSEFNCFDCHHDLNPAGRPTPASGGRRGLIGWHRGAELRRLAGKAALATDLLEEMNRRLPSAHRLRLIVPALGGVLKSPPTPPAGLLKWARPGKEELGGLNWDEAGWLYHALVAVELARRERAGQGAVEMDRRFAALAELLRLDRDGGPAEGRYHSPKRHDPAAIHAPLREVMDRLEQLLRGPPGPG